MPLATFLCRSDFGTNRADIGEKKWRQFTSDDDLLNGLREKVKQAILPVRDAAAAARNIFYASMESEQESETVKQKLKILIDKALVTIQIHHLIPNLN